MPPLFTGSLIFIINLIYFFLDKQFFCVLVCGRGYDFIKDFPEILFFYGIIGLVYGFIRLSLQQKFINFFQRKYLSISNFVNKKGVLIIIILGIINLILLSLIIIDHDSYGKKFHLSNDPEFSHHWTNIAIENNNIQTCEILDNSRKVCEDLYKNGKDKKMICGNKNICISKVLDKKSKVLDYQSMLDECNLLSKKSKSFCNKYIIDNWKNIKK